MPFYSEVTIYTPTKQIPIFNSCLHFQIHFFHRFYAIILIFLYQNWIKQIDKTRLQPKIKNRFVEFWNDISPNQFLIFHLFAIPFVLQALALIFLWIIAFWLILCLHTL